MNERKECGFGNGGEPRLCIAGHFRVLAWPSLFSSFFFFFFQCMYIFAPGSWLVIHVLLWCSGRCHAGLVDSERSCRREREVRREESSQSFEKVARVWKVAA